MNTILLRKSKFATEPQVMPGGDIAIATSYIDNRTRSPDGTKSTSRAFETDVWQKTDGKWKIISLHYSGISAQE